MTYFYAPIATIVSGVLAYNRPHLAPKKCDPPCNPHFVPPLNIQVITAISPCCEL